MLSFALLLRIIRRYAATVLQCLLFSLRFLLCLKGLQCLRKCNSLCISVSILLRFIVLNLLC
ncbi:MAG: hypothetical protein CME82_11415 [Halomonas sp.]|nr:hypothetical protein [Halomonas sp.]